PRGRLEGALRRAADRRARRTRRHQPLQNRIRLCRGGGDRNRPPGARNAASGDELGHGANPSAVQEVAVPPVRSPDEQEAGNKPRPAADPRGGETTARHRAHKDEHTGASVRWAVAARPNHRRNRALLPSRRDAAHPEQTGQLGDVPDWDTWRYG